MLHSRLASPKTNKSQIRLQHQIVGRSKSTSNLVPTIRKKQNYTNPNDNRQIKSLIRAASAFKLSNARQTNVGLPKVSNVKGKLHLGKLYKPGLVLSSEMRNNPWVQPTPVNQQIIQKKGLMEMITMGMIPRNADFTELLNHKYQEKKQKPEFPQINQQENNDITTIFPTNPNIVSSNQPSKNQTQQKNQLIPPCQNSETQKQSNNDKKIRKKIKKSSNKKQKKNQFLLQIPQQVIVLQINNQRIVQNQQYQQQLRKAKKNGNQITLKQYIKNVENFANKYGLIKFDFKILIDETRKITDQIIKNQIINAKALGIHYSMKGNLNKRTKDILRMFLIKYKFQKTRRELLKIQVIKRYFKVKKYYEEMTKKRIDLIKFKLSSFAERQRRFIQQTRERDGNQRFRCQIHILSISGETYDEQLSYYKLQCRNNIQLTRIFNTEPQKIILLLDQSEYDIGCWLELTKKIKGYHPKVQTIFSNFQSYKVKRYDSIYYGISSSIMARIKKIRQKTDSMCVIPNALNMSIVKICQTLSCKLYGSTFRKQDLQKLLRDDDQQQFKYSISHRPHTDQKQPSKVKFSNQLIRNIAKQSGESIGNTKQYKAGIKQKITQSQINHSYQKARGRQLLQYKLAGEQFTNKLKIKQQILLANKISTPLSITFNPHTEQRELFYKLTQIVLEEKNINKWVLKIGNSARFSRGLAFLQTDTLKILKQKKKKPKLTQADITEVADIMKIILLDKLQIPQNSLQDSTEYLQCFLKYGGYVEAVLPGASSQCIFGQMSSIGQFKILGSYSKIYTNQCINCAATYPANHISKQIVQQTYKLASVLYENQGIFGYISFELLYDSIAKRHYFIDMLLTLEQYSSLYFMYSYFFMNISQQEPQPVKIVKKYQAKQGKKHIISKDKDALLSNNQPQNKQNQQQRGDYVKNNIQEIPNLLQQTTPLMRKIIYIPFIDNNGNTYQDFQSFEEKCINKNLSILDFQTIQGMKFLYLNLKQQKPDVLSLVIFATSQKKALKYALDGLNFLSETGQKTNKFDKKVQRRKYDCLYMNDIIWKFRQIKKAKDVLNPKQI